MTLIDILIRRAKRKYSKKYELIITLLGIIFFAVLVPAAIVYTSPYNIVLGLVLIIAGISFAAWALWCQWNIGKGTPVPVAPTQKLIVTGPYTYCRNPMVFGVLASMYVKFVKGVRAEIWRRVRRVQEEHAVHDTAPEKA